MERWNVRHVTSEGDNLGMEGLAFGLKQERARSDRALKSPM